MSDHLPECGYSPGQPGFGGINSGIPSTQPYLAPSPCICDRLRACEHRVLDAIDLPAANVQYQKVGYADGLDAAREAVAALDVPADWIGSTRHGLDNALAAIDALKEKP